MNRFRDVPLPTGVRGFPTTSAPRFNVDLVEVASGDESANELWSYALHTFKLPDAIRDQTTFEALRSQWYIMGGPARLFPFTDPLDFSSVPQICAGEAPAIAATDVLIGVGNGVQVRFQLRKSYTREGFTYYRPIQLPVVASVLVAIDGVDPASAPGGPFVYTVEREGGALVFTTPIPNGRVVTAGFNFEVPVRFESNDQFSGVTKAFQLSGFSDLTLLEKRLC